jgi:drug/metabolite transporter (DMT)-like permease
MTLTPAEPKKNLSLLAFSTLLLVAFLMGSNHVAARIAFNQGLDVFTAVVVRSVFTALVVSVLIYVQKIPLSINARHWKILPMIGVLIAVQSAALYTSVAQLPVSLALLTFNSYPLMTAFWARVLYKNSPDKIVLQLMPVMLFGLALALDITGTASGLGAKAQWSAIGLGVACALVASACFGLALVLIQFETKGLDGRVRTASTMWMVSVLALIATQSLGDFHWPHVFEGWVGLVGLCIFYSSGITLMFTVLPKLGVVGNSAILNLEPIFALAMAWFILSQSITILQLLGAFIVVGVVIRLGMRKN